MGRNLANTRANIGPSVDNLVDRTFLQMSGEAKQITERRKPSRRPLICKRKTGSAPPVGRTSPQSLILDDGKRRFKEVSQAGFAPKGAERRIRLNVGGKIFETTAATLTRDPGSMLDALCREDSLLAQIEAAQAKLPRPQLGRKGGRGH